MSKRKIRCGLGPLPSSDRESRRLSAITFLPGVKIRENERGITSSQDQEKKTQGDVTIEREEGVKEELWPPRAHSSNVQGERKRDHGNAAASKERRETG